MKCNKGSDNLAFAKTLPNTPNRTRLRTVPRPHVIKLYLTFTITVNLNDIYTVYTMSLRWPSFTDTFGD